MNPEQEPSQGPEEDTLDETELNGPEQAVEILSKYWAAEKDGEKLWETLKEKRREFWEALQRKNFFNMWRLAYGVYFGFSGSSSSSFSTQTISFAGEDGELIDLSINEIRSFFDQIFNLTTRNRPAFQAQVRNNDARSLSEVESSDTMVQYFYEQEYGERKEKEVVKIEGIYGKSYTHIEWDPDGGTDIDVPPEPVQTPAGEIPGPPEAATTERTGEFVITRLYPWDVICEFSRSEFDGHLWRMVPAPKRSKWELMERYPAFANAINESECEQDSLENQFPGADPQAREAEDLANVWIFYHKPTLTLPRGRKVTFCNGIMVDDSDLPIEEIPVYPFMSCELHRTCMGVSDLWNLIPAEQLQNQILSDMATNIEAFGRPPLVMTEGTDVDLDALANGQRILFIPPNTPTPETVKYPQVPDVGFKLVELMRHFKQSLSGLNAISRGDTSSNVTSGAHAALYSQIAVEAQDPRTQSLDLHREQIANSLLMHLKKFGKHPQLVSIVGVDERAYVDEFTQDDWNGVHRVVMKTANPAMKTPAGKLQIAEMLLSLKDSPIRDPEQVIQLVTAGTLKPAYNPARVSQIACKRENELLLAGPAVQEVPGDVDPMTGMPGPSRKTVPTVPVFPWDDSKKHLQAHLEVAYSPAALKDPKIMEAVTAHIMDHVFVARSGDPYLAQLLEIPAPQMATDPGMAPPEGEDSMSEGAANDAGEDMTPPAEDDSVGARIPTAAKPSSPNGAAQGA